MTIYQAGALSIAAGMVHVLSDFEYWGVWWGYGIFFAVTGLLQISAGIMLFMQPWDDGAGGYRPARGWIGSRAMFVTGIVFNGAIVLLWIIAHTLGVPMGPRGGQPEPVTLISVVALGIMVALVWQLVAIVRTPHLFVSGGSPMPVEPTYK